MKASVTMRASRGQNPVRHQQWCVPLHCSANRRRVNSATNSGACNTDNGATSTALSITAGAAASALLAKLTALVAVAGVAPGALVNVQTAQKISDNTHLRSAHHQADFAPKVPVARAPAPTSILAPVPSLPSTWQLVHSAAEWLDHNRQAAASGALLATVFISEPAARAHSALLERLRRSYGDGPDAPVRFIFVHIGQDYDQRNRAAAAAAASALTRGSQGLTLGRLSHTAALHGLDVALSAFLPDGIRAFPSLLLTAGAPPADSSGHHWVAATRVNELTQLVSDWVFINRRAAAASAAAASTARTALKTDPASGKNGARRRAAPGAAAGAAAGAVGGSLQEAQERRLQRDEPVLVAA